MTLLQCPEGVTVSGDLCSASLQGDHSPCAKPPVDFKTKILLWPGQAKVNLLFWSQREVLHKLNGHPVYLWCFSFAKMVEINYNHRSLTRRRLCTFCSKGKVSAMHNFPQNNPAFVLHSEVNIASLDPKHATKTLRRDWPDFRQFLSVWAFHFYIDILMSSCN